MEYEEAKRKFVNSWGTLGNAWGINKTMAQIHALLMISPDPLNTDDIIEELGISRGNVSMSLKGLMEWGIVFKDFKTGDRKDYFYAEKDVWKLASQVAKERRRRELEPLLEILGELSTVKFNAKDKNEKAFNEVTTELNKFAVQGDKLISKFNKMESKWFFNIAMKLFK